MAVAHTKTQEDAIVSVSIEGAVIHYGASSGETGLSLEGDSCGTCL